MINTLKRISCLAVFMTAFLMLAFLAESYADLRTYPAIDENNPVITFTHDITKKDEETGKPYTLSFESSAFKAGSLVIDGKVYDISRKHSVPKPIHAGYHKDGTGDRLVVDGTRYALHCIREIPSVRRPDESENSIRTYKAEYELVKVAKRKNTMKVSDIDKIVKYKTLKKKSVIINPMVVKSAQGSVTYTKTKGNKKITVNTKTGSFKLAKGLKKGTYKVKTDVRAAGNSLYRALTVHMTTTIKVK